MFRLFATIWFAIATWDLVTGASQAEITKSTRFVMMNVEIAILYTLLSIRDRIDMAIDRSERRETSPRPESQRSA